MKFEGPLVWPKKEKITLTKNTLAINQVVESDQRRKYDKQENEKQNFSAAMNN